MYNQAAAAVIAALNDEPIKIVPTPFEPLEANMLHKSRKTDEQLDYIARTTLAERINDFLMVVDMKAEPNVFTDNIPSADAVWTDIQLNEVR